MKVIFIIKKMEVIFFILRIILIFFPKKKKFVGKITYIFK